ncbi:hypothetical protein HOK51_07465 [Candidatus Woesearchaeota archaeon]|jgi:hypothetical protein|nr:hypothetical protein [Candidatus Woesearchaeota archaeon]MBT6519661.1 hypothetical protein [Candidatus Woesearchaeota archaeon]MBT7368693.1 hypothetical protein [Candidatus Woesearchaeota archaeon]
MDNENQIPQIDAGKIAAMYQLSQDAVKILDYFTDKPGRTIIPTSDIENASKFIEYFEEYDQTVDFLINLHNRATEIKPGLKESLELTNNTNLPTSTTTKDSNDRGLLDIIESTEIRIRETTTETFSKYNKSTSNIDPVKPPIKLKIQIKQLNSAIKELYTNKNILQLHSAFSNIMQTTEEIFRPMVPQKGDWHYHEDDARTEYLAALKILKEESKGQKAVEVKYKLNNCIVIELVKQIPFPKPKKKWNLFLKRKKVSDYAKLGEE